MRAFQILSCRVAPLMLTILTAFASSGVAQDVQGPPQKWQFRSELLQPFWCTSTMYGETVLFLDDGDGQLPHASLLFPPTRILSVFSSSGDLKYEEGRDYIWKSGSDKLLLPRGSRIVCKTPQDLIRPAGTQQYRLTRRDGNGEILFGGGHEYHDMQTVVTYEHEPGQWKGPQLRFTGTELPRTLAKLKRREPITIALLGDSISTGCNASQWAGAAPWQPPFQDLFVQQLRSVYGGDVTLKNFSVGGKDSAWGLQVIDQVTEVHPDLVILAFGMNDSAGRSAADFKSNTQGMITALRKVYPDTEFILIATMLGNRQWIALHQELFPQYRDALAELSHDGVALADMTSMWAELLRHKRDWDMTGNGVNHPNDFGHRVYAQVLSTLLIP